MAYSYYPKLDIVTGFAAKSVCSCTFEDQRKQQIIEAEDNNIDPIQYAKNEINYQEKSVTSTFFGLKKRKAIYKEGVGCVLLSEENRNNNLASLQPTRVKLQNNLAFPYGNLEPQKAFFNNVNPQKLQLAVQNAFDLNNEKIKKTRAVLVVYKDQIIAEKYADGFNKNSKLLGWSMTKSITSATFMGSLTILDVGIPRNFSKANLYPIYTQMKKAEI